MSIVKGATDRALTLLRGLPRVCLTNIRDNPERSRVSYLFVIFTLYYCTLLSSYVVL